MFIALKMEVYKLDINNVPTSMNNLRRKVDDLDVCKLKTVLILVLFYVQYFRMLFLSLKKVQMLKITPYQIVTTI